MDRKYMLNDLLRFSAEEQMKYKLHLAWKSQDELEPYDEFCESWDKWVFWQRWRGPNNNNDFNREYIFSLFKDYKCKEENVYIYGGAFKVLKTLSDFRETYIGYDVELTPLLEPLIGRLVLRLTDYRAPRGRSFYLESHMDYLEVLGILPQPVNELKSPRI